MAREARRCTSCYKQMGVTVPAHGLSCPFFKPCSCCINQPLPLRRRPSRSKSKCAQNRTKRRNTLTEMDKENILRLVQDLVNGQQSQPVYNVLSTYQAIPRADNINLLLIPVNILAEVENVQECAASQEIENMTVDESYASLSNIDTSSLNNPSTSRGSSIEGRLCTFTEIMYSESDDDPLNNSNISSEMTCSDVDASSSILNHYSEMIDNDSGDALLKSLSVIIGAEQEYGVQNDGLVREDQCVNMFSSSFDLGLTIEPSHLEWSLIDFVLEEEKPDIASIIKQALETVNNPEIDFI